MNEAGGPALPPPRKASEWMVALLEAPDDPDLRRRFDAWLSADPAHAVDWNEVSATLAALEDLREECSERTRAPVPPPVRRGRWAALGVMTVLAAAIAIAAPGLMTRLQADHWTRVAEQRTVTLPDGSSVQLAPETAIDVAFDHRRRLVRLLKGEALFNVLHQSERPFSVEANGVEVVDIGTAFDVRRRTGGVDVAVLEGLIEVTSPRSAPAVRERLQAGDWMRAVADKPAERGRMPVEEVAAWTRKRLVVKNQPVSEIVDALRPYFDGLIFVRDETVARERLTGVYDLSNPVEAVRAIARAQGARVIEVSPWILILSSR